MTMSWLGAKFDWDGVVVDSSDLHLKSWEALSKELNRELPADHFEKGFGKRNEAIIPEILHWSNDPHQIDQWGKRKEEIYRSLGRSEGIRLGLGALSFLKDLQALGIKCAIGTSTERSNVQLALDQHGLGHFFLGSACSEDVSQGKPDPEVFLVAAKILHLPPEQCVIFEDSPHGIDAGKRAKMKTIALTTSHPADVFMNLKPDLVIGSLAEVTPKQILELFH